MKHFKENLYRNFEEIYRDFPRIWRNLGKKLKWTEEINKKKKLPNFCDNFL